MMAHAGAFKGISWAYATHEIAAKVTPKMRGRAFILPANVLVCGGPAPVDEVPGG
jgi:hypothetical protein